MNGKSDDTEMPVIIVFNEKVDDLKLDEVSKKIGIIVVDCFCSCIQQVIRLLLIGK